MTAPFERGLLVSADLLRAFWAVISFLLPDVVDLSFLLTICFNYVNVNICWPRTVAQYSEIPRVPHKALRQNADFELWAVDFIQRCSPMQSKVFILRTC